MTSDLRDLYQQVVLDHGRHPRNFHELEGANCQSVGYNPLCGDKLTIYATYEDDVIKEISFKGAGCAISTASASLLTEVLKGKSRGDADELLEAFLAMLTEDAEPDLEKIGKLAVFGGVKEFPIRVKCATLAWRTFEAAITGKGEEVTTE